MDLNLQNIEEAIFFDKKVQGLLPEFRHLFDQWSISKRVPGMQNLGKRTVIEFLNSLEADHVRRIGEYFGETIIVDKIDGNLVRDYEGDSELAEDDLCQFAGFKDCAVYRDCGRVYITYWR